MSGKRPIDAVDLLDADHKAVRKLLAEYNNLAARKACAHKRKALAERICLELTIHARLEEEIFYPPVRQALGDEDLMDEAEVEHASARDLIRQLLAMGAHEELYDAKLAVLGEYVEHHIRHEREWMFPRVRKCNLDLQALGERLAQRKEELNAVPEALREDLLASLAA